MLTTAKSVGSTTRPSVLDARWAEDGATKPRSEGSIGGAEFLSFFSLELLPEPRHAGFEGPERSMRLLWDKGGAL